MALRYIKTAILSLVEIRPLIICVSTCPAICGNMVKRGWHGNIRMTTESILGNSIILRFLIWLTTT